MDQPSTENHKLQNKAARRTSKHQSDRDYICPCGKSYLSYPALFTHIKQKHNGDAPGEIVKPKNLASVKRGRPRLHQTNSQEKSTANYDKIEKISKQLEDLGGYLTGSCPASEIADLSSKYQSTALFLRFKSFQQKKTIITSIPQKISCEQAYFQFLDELHSTSHLTKYFSDIWIILSLFCRAFDQQNSKQEQLIMNQHLDDVIDFTNEFILKYAAKYLQLQEIKQIGCLKVEKMWKILCHIWSWMHKKGYCSKWLKLNPQFLI